MIFATSKAIWHCKTLGTYKKKVTRSVPKQIIWPLLMQCFAIPGSRSAVCSSGRIRAPEVFKKQS